jgi:hypothetical protein
MEENKNRQSVLSGRGKGMHIPRVLQLDIRGKNKARNKERKHTHQKPGKEGSRT